MPAGKKQGSGAKQHNGKHGGMHGGKYAETLAKHVERIDDELESFMKHMVAYFEAQEGSAMQGAAVGFLVEQFGVSKETRQMRKAYTEAHAQQNELKNKIAEGEKARQNMATLEQKLTDIDHFFAGETEDASDGPILALAVRQHGVAPAPQSNMDELDSNVAARSAMEEADAARRSMGEMPGR